MLKNTRGVTISYYDKKNDPGGQRCPSTSDCSHPVLPKSTFRSFQLCTHRCNAKTLTGSSECNYTGNGNDQNHNNNYLVFFFFANGGQWAGMESQSHTRACIPDSNTSRKPRSGFRKSLHLNFIFKYQLLYFTCPHPPRPPPPNHSFTNTF